MPSYVGIGTSITHNVEVDGNLFLQDIEGGPSSTRVPLEIFSNLVSSSVEAENSRMLRLRVQNYGETNTDNSYVTDMGIRGDPGKDYFFITAPQNTSNVGDQNTFVISSTSNVGIGTTDPAKPLHVVGDSWITGTLTASNIIGASPVTFSSSIMMAPGTTLTAGAIEPPADSDSNLKITGTITTSNITHDSELTVTTNLLMGSDKTLTTSNIVANAGDNLLISSNLEVGTSNLFVDTTTGNVGIGITIPTKPLHVVGDSWITGTLTASNIIGASPVTISSNLVMASGFTLTAGAIEPPAGSESNLKITGTITTSNITHDSELTITSNLLMGSDKTLTTSNIVANSGENLSLNSNLFVDTATGRVGIGITEPSAPLHVYKSSNYPEVFVDYGAGGQKMSLATGTSGSVFGWSGYLVMGTINGAQLDGFSEKVRIDSSGRVGIGVAPSYKLHVYENSTNPITSLSSGDAVLYTFGINSTHGRETIGVQTTVDNNAFGNYSQGEERYVLALQPYKGRVGIGKTNPTQKLDVNGYIKQNNTYFFVSDTRTTFTSWINFGNSAITTYGSHWNASNQRFTAPVTGLYIFTFNGFTIDGQHFGIGYNGTYPDTATYSGKQLWAINGGTGGSTSWFLKLNVNDYITLTLYNSGNLNANRCYFMGGLLYAV